MAFCGYCGAQMPEDMSFCTECGKPLGKKKQLVNESITSILMQPANQSISIDRADEQTQDVEQNDNISSVQGGDMEVDPLNYFNSIKQDSEFDVHTTSHLQDQDNNAEGLYQTLENDAEKQKKAEKKKLILPLVMTLLFIGIVVAVVLIKFKPFNRFVNGGEKSAARAKESVQTEESVQPETTSQPETAQEKPSQQSPLSQDNPTKPSNEEYLEPEIKDLLICFQPFNRYSDDVYIDFCYEIYNPNSDVMISAMDLTLSVRDESNAILATSTARANIIMPGDTVYAFGTLSLTESEAATIVSDDTQYEWDYATESRFYSTIRTSEIVVSNISARGSGYDTRVTGEIANNSSYDTSDFTKVYVMFWEDDELVAIDSTYIDPIYSESSRAFDLNGTQNIPDYDSVQVFVDVW